MEYRVATIAEILKGKLIGEGNEFITRPAGIEQATKGTITFLANAKYKSFIYSTQASAILVPEDFHAEKPLQCALIKVAHPYSAFANVLELFQRDWYPSKGISKKASIAAEVVLGAGTVVGDYAFIGAKSHLGTNCQIYPQVFIGPEVTIGNNVILYPGVKIYHQCQIGNNCVIHANAVIGSDGFGFAPQADGTFRKVPQIGKVILEDQVEIGANSVIDRATMGSTIIEKGTKLDNLIQIGHNVRVGSNTVIAAQAGIAGSTTIGKNCQIGGQAGFVGHISVADGVHVQAQSGVAASIEKIGNKVYGYPAINYRDYLKAYALFRQLPELEKRIRLLEKTEK